MDVWSTEPSGDVETTQELSRRGVELHEESVSPHSQRGRERSKQVLVRQKDIYGFRIYLSRPCVLESENAMPCTWGMYKLMSSLNQKKYYIYY